MKKVTFIIVLIALLVSAGLLIRQEKVQAYSCTPTRSSACGYFKDSFMNANDNVLPNNWIGNALVGVNSAASFKARIAAFLFSGDYHSYVGAAYIVDSMLNYRGSGASFPAGNGVSNGVNFARNAANWQAWQNLVDGYANPTNGNYGINWSYYPAGGEQAFCSGRADSGYDPGRGDVALYRTPAYNTFNCNYEWTHSMPEIQFKFPAGTFDIGTLCGNVQDSANIIESPNHLPTGTISVKCIDPNTGLQSAHITFSDPDLATTAEFTVAGQLYGPYGTSPSDISLLLPPTTDAYNKQTVTLLVKDSGPLGDQAYHTILPTVQTDSPCVNFGCTGAVTTPTVLDPYTSYSLTLGVKVSVGQSPPNPTIDIQSIVTPGGSTYYTHGQIAASDNAGVVGATFSGIPSTGGITGQFTANWRLYSNGTLLAACPGTFNVINLPYLNVYGGDVMTGAAPAVGATCSINNAAGAYSWNQYGAGYAGAGSEYAVQALAQIDEFGSAMNPSSSSPPVGLSFANSAIAAGKVNLSQGLYGGFFGDSSGAWACGTDYTKGLSPISGAAATTQIANIPPTPGDAQINDGQQLRIYATGDVYISRNIAYQPGAWPKIDQIPFFELVVTGGNIYIDSSVTQLDGIYIAEPSGAAGGQIIDCATNAGGILKQVDPTVNGFYSTCNKQLVINGAFVAKQVLFGRTNGSLGQATAGDSLGSNHDAEVFNYTPEIWLPRNAATPSDTYDAITALPPVL